MYKDTSDWVWLASHKCTELEIAQARAEGDKHWYVNEDGIGFVLVPPDDKRLEPTQ